MGWVGASTRSVLVEPGADEPTEIHQRATWIMEKHSGEWRIVHEHVSFPTDAPYGAEDLAG
jgi:ketosteroid isomerase-like protein